ncbi:ASCH domain-containing protein [Microbacteriaceae bacterium VKM Ac-2855]|nr:ASCH domain-containing protein [Microbacteriaceae bacterium VKM Ac-2855]
MVLIPDEPIRTPLPQPDAGAAEHMWAEYVLAHPQRAALGDEHPVSMFGDSVEFADLSLGAVLRGLKTGTASLVVEYAEDDEPLPRIGGHWIACDGSGRPRAVLRTVSLELGPIESLTESFAWDEGENDRSRAGWLAGHRRYWQRTRTAVGSMWSEELEVVFERIRVVWPPHAAEQAQTFAASQAARPLP